MLKFDNFELLKQYYLYDGLLGFPFPRFPNDSWQYSSMKVKQEIINIWKDTYFEYINFGLDFLKEKEKSLLRSFDLSIVKEWLSWCERKNNRTNQLMQDELSKRGKQELFDEISKYAPYDIFSIKSYVVKNAENLSIEMVAFMLLVYVCVRKDYKTDEEVSFFKSELDNIDSLLWKKVIRTINCLIKDDVKMCSLFRYHLHEDFRRDVETFVISQKAQSSIISKSHRANFKLDWQNVEFKKDSIVIYPSPYNIVKFKPKEISLKGSRQVFNFLKKNFYDKIPEVYCVAYKMQVEVISEMELEMAILYISELYKDYIARKGVIGCMNFEECYEVGLNIDSNYLKKYDSRYLDCLIELQSDNYRVIPLKEYFVYRDGGYLLEEAFMFTREMKKSPDHLMVIIENVNPDRATLIFTINKNNYMKTINMIYDYMVGRDYNKRSLLRIHAEKQIDNKDIVDFKANNHDYYYSWKRRLGRFV